MGHSLWFTGVSGLMGLLGLVGAIVLFTRSRSAATTLFLVGCAVQAVLPFMSWLAGHNLPLYFGVITLANLCAGIGLLWYALQLPKAAPPAPAPAQGGNPLLK